MEVGDKVYVLRDDGSEELGVIELVASSTIWHMGHPSIKLEYGVKVGKEKYMTYFPENKLRLDLSSLFGPTCTCGAVKAAKPYKPAGHAHYCDIKEIK